MEKDFEIFRGAIEAAQNHLDRAQEGRDLLAKGRPLSEMTTKPMGLSDEQTVKRRENFVEWLQELNDDELRFTFQNTMRQLHRRWDDPDKGTSELELRRLLYEDEFRSRNIKPPTELDKKSTSAEEKPK